MARVVPHARLRTRPHATLPLCHCAMAAYRLRHASAMSLTCQRWIRSTNGPFQTDRAAGKYDSMLASTRVIVRDEGLGAMYKVPAQPRPAGIRNILRIVKRCVSRGRKARLRCTRGSSAASVLSALVRPTGGGPQHAPAAYPLSVRYSVRFRHCGRFCAGAHSDDRTAVVGAVRQVRWVLRPQERPLSAPSVPRKTPSAADTTQRTEIPMSGRFGRES
jgi:hypothetical protein